MMTKYFFFKDNKPLELGNLSDWVSSLSTLGTLVVAYKAFKAAPNWLSQKFDEESLKSGLSINRIIKVDYKNAVINLRNYLSTNKITEDVHLLYYHNTLIHSERIKIINTSFNKIKFYLRFNICHEVSEVTNKLESEITKLNMIEWHILPEKNININSLHEKIKKIKKLEMKAKEIISVIFDQTETGFYNYKSQKIEIDNLENIRDEIISIEAEIHSLTREIIECIDEYGSTKSFRSYFHRIIE
ncbi:hypothetical protein [Erwinia sp. JH02]|uniref:hypothetical protein n=1 Tax=Erwinia sp. JH02 TaxID=2733394 RepID=UPI001489EE14|nr:hypothetical protein [Erwinia sp. JH02]NNS06218.1 hypothetical protein [Erwinia sp. JH02]